MSFGPLEILLVIVLIALVFGARKLPELGKGLGQGIKEFRKESHGAQHQVTDVPSRPLDSVTAPRPEVGHVGETPAERDHRA